MFINVSILIYIRYADIFIHENSFIFIYCLGIIKLERLAMVNKIISEEYIDLLVENSTVSLYNAGNDVTPINSTHSLVNVPAQSDKCILGKKYPYHVFPSILTLESFISLEEAGVQRVRNSPLLGYTGIGIIIGIIDTGIEYTHEAFLNPDGTTRILSIWDQTINDGTPPPTGLTYGAEYNQDIINEALQSDDPYSVVPSRDEIGHGTMIAGIAGGNTKESANFSGVVPECKFIVVKLKPAKKVNTAILSLPPDKLCYQESDIMFGVRYILSIIERLRRPLVLCIAAGTSQAGHDGIGATSNYLKAVTLMPRNCVVISAGNEGNAKRHYYEKIKTSQTPSIFELKISDKDKSFYMEIWHQALNAITIDITTPSGEYMSPIEPTLKSCLQFNLKNNFSVVWVNNIISEAETGDQLILIRFENPEAGIWKFGIYNKETITMDIHAWLPSGNIISNETFFIKSSSDVTITSPGNASYPITVTAYDPVSGEIAANSGRGYTRSGFVKPDLSAPGVNLVCPALNNSYCTVSGTGAAAAFTAGIASIVLDWGVVSGNFTNINGYDIKKLLIRGAKRSGDISYPNNIWGYGKIDAYGVFEKLRE